MSKSRTQRAGRPSPAAALRSEPHGGRNDLPAGPQRLVAACFFLSGFAGLVLQTVWARSLALNIGGSAAGVTAVVTAYMTGLGLGSLLASGWMGRVRRPLQLYAWLEAGVAVFAIASPWLLAAPEPLYRLAHDGEEVSAMLPFAVRFITSLALLVIPTTAMGATLPLIVTGLARRRLATRPSETTPAAPEAVALLYGINTVGAVAGTLLAGFVLLPGFGVTKTLWVAAGVDIALAGVILLRLAPLLERASSRIDSTVPDTRSGAPRALEEPIPAGLRRAALMAFAVSGGLSMVYELGWTRRLVTLWGSSVYSFTLLLATFLAGIGIGSLAAQRLTEKTRRPVSMFSWGLVATGLFALAGTSLLGAVPALFQRLLAGAASPGRILAGEAVIACVVLLPAAVVLGAIFPLAARIARRGSEDPGRAAGRAYAVNTAGTVLGAAGSGLVLLPAVGSLPALRGAAALHLVSGFVLAALVARAGRGEADHAGAVRRQIAAFAAAAVAFGALWVFVPEPDPWRMNYGVVKLLRDIRQKAPPPLSSEALAAEPVRPVRLLSLEDGASATVAVTTSWHLRSLIINGKTDASTEDPTMVLTGQLPMMLAEAPKRVLVIGYGSGVTTHSVLTYPSVERVETVEIEPAVVRAGRFFSDLNGQDHPDPRAVQFTEDGRVHLAYSRAVYDVIISEPSNPWIAGINNLFTREFYRLVRARLAPGGVFCQWLQSYELTGGTLGSLLGTVQEAFPDAEVYRQGVDLLVLWKEGGAFIDRSRAVAAFAHPEVRSDLALVGFASPEEILPVYLGPIRSLVSKTAASPPNTDDFPFVEFQAPFDLLRGGSSDLLPFPPLLELRLERWDPDLSPSERLAPLARLPGCLRSRTRSLEVLAALERSGATVLAEDLRGQIARLDDTHRNGERIRELFRSAEQAYAARKLEEAEPFIQQALRLDPESAEGWYRYGSLLVKAREMDAAEVVLNRSLELHRRDLSLSGANVGNPYQCEIYLGVIASERGDMEGALAHFERARVINPWQAVAHFYRALALRALGRGEEARRDLETGLRLDPLDGLLRNLAREMGVAGAE